jgi:threonine dehydrogenase-like Zn-dependent dehydrogenase
VLVRTQYSPESAGTERLVYDGRVPADQHERMRAPHQAGDFPGPVKYGYLSVGVVEQGASAYVGLPVFCLYPHQTEYVVPVADVTPVPDDVPADRAVLTGTVETAVNALWDAPPSVGDRVTVVGGGMVGCSIAALLARMPGVEATLVDVDPTRARTAAELGVGFALPDQAPDEQDLVFHTSATAAGLQTSLSLLATDATVVELSWYGDRDVSLSLGGDFHSRRLSVRASQVGAVPVRRRARWTHAQRRALALDLLKDPAFDHLLTGTSHFEELPDVMKHLSAGLLDGICHTITYQ